MAKKKYILWYKEISVKDVPLVGGKNASLGEMFSQLTRKGVNIPDGFALTSKAYWYYLKRNKIDKELKKIFKKFNPDSLESLKKTGKAARQLILGVDFPEDLKKEIVKNYKKLSRKYGQENVDLAVRSSATAEDLPSISENEHILVRIDNKPVYKKMKDIYKLVGSGEGFRIEIPSLENEEIAWNKVEEVYKHRANKSKLYKIRTATGREITVSPNHTLIVLDEDTLIPKEVKSIKDLKGNEKLPVINKLPSLLSNSKVVNILDYIKRDDVIEHDGVVKIKNKSANWKIQNGFIKNIPVNRNFAYFLGIYEAEGSTYSNNCIMVTNRDKDIQKRTIGIFKEFDLYKKQKINKGTLRVYSKPLVRFLHEVTGEPLKTQKGKGRGCKIKEVPSFVFGWNGELIGEFLKGCFDGDGYVSKVSIIYTSTSEMLIGGMVKLLEILGVDFYLRRKRRSIDIIIPGYEAEKFRKIISFESREKRRKLNELIESYNNLPKHIQFKNRINITESLSRLIKKEFESELPKREVEIYLCPSCKEELKISGKYRNRKRFYCKSCHKMFYENEIRKQTEKKYVYYDRKGRFIKGATPWNKALLSGSYSDRKFEELIKRYKIKPFNYLSDKSLIWDRIKEITSFRYNGWVYDFVVPKTQNFAAGIGGIITHNSASFAGQHETYLNISNPDDLLKAVKKCMASLFTDRAIAYREEKGFNHLKIALSVGIQKMVGSGSASAGIMFTLDTETGFSDVILINSIFGIGEMIVKGKITPDQFYVFKPTLKKGYESIISKDLGRKNKKYIYAKKGGLKEVKVSPKDQIKFSITDKEVLILAKWAQIIEDHYSGKAKKWMPQDIEWAKDARTNQLFIVQSRPETVHAVKTRTTFEEYQIKSSKKPVLEGIAIGAKIAQGRTRIIPSILNMSQFQKGEILITKMTDPDWVPIMRIASAIITEEGSKSCHAAIIARELGIPCIVGTRKATTIFKSGQEITVDCTQGLNGRIFLGKVPYKIKKYNLKKIPKLKTKIMINIGAPEIAFKTSFLPNDGVGLARQEFIIAEKIRIHPLALYHFNKIKDVRVKKEIERLTAGYNNKRQYFVDKLAEGIAQIAAAFWPKPVIIRLSDFKTKEYRCLIGGEPFEGEEANPMLGFRGASRYLDKGFQPAFEMECQAIKKAREEFGLKNIKVMIPFCRTVEEGKKVLGLMKKFGLERGKDDLKVIIMCEIPSNVVLVDDFLKISDGMSIGSNDLTQLTLGMDRDNAQIAYIGDERNEAVKKLVSQVIKACNKKKKYCGICGDAPSSLPDFANFLLDHKIPSISLSPDAVIQTILNLAKRKQK